MLSQTTQWLYMIKMKDQTKMLFRKTTEQKKEKKKKQGLTYPAFQ